MPNFLDKPPAPFTLLPHERITVKPPQMPQALACALRAARQAGSLMRHNQGSVKKINKQSQYDIKLELDVLCQKLIEKTLLSAFPQSAILGEEGVAGAAARIGAGWLTPLMARSTSPMAFHMPASRSLCNGAPGFRRFLNGHWRRL